MTQEVNVGTFLLIAFDCIDIETWGGGLLILLFYIHIKMKKFFRGERFRSKSWAG